MRLPVSALSWWKRTVLRETAENSFTGTFTRPKEIAPLQIDRGMGHIVVPRASGAQRPHGELREDALVPASGRDLARLLDQLVSEAPGGLSILDPELRFVYVNERLAAAGGRRPEDIVGRLVEDVYGDAGAHAPRARAPALDGTRVGDWRVVYDGRVYSVDAFPLRDGGEVVAIGTTALGVT